MSYRVFIRYLCLNFVIFLNSASSAAALDFYLPGVCTHTDTAPRENRERPESGIFQNSRKKPTKFNEHPVLDFKIVKIPKKGKAKVSCK